jgi:hypothetical protein
MSLTMNPETGHYAYWAAYNGTNNNPVAGILLNNAPKLVLRHGQTRTHLSQREG